MSRALPSPGRRPRDRRSSPGVAWTPGHFTAKIHPAQACASTFIMPYSPFQRGPQTPAINVGAIPDAIERQGGLISTGADTDAAKDNLIGYCVREYKRTPRRRAFLQGPDSARPVLLKERLERLRTVRLLPPPSCAFPPLTSLQSVGRGAGKRWHTREGSFAPTAARFP